MANIDKNLLEHAFKDFITLIPYKYTNEGKLTHEDVFTRLSGIKTNADALAWFTNACLNELDRCAVKSEATPDPH